MKTKFIILALLLPLTTWAQSISIIGDSYSTYEDFMTPATNELWYYAKNDTAKTDVSSVKQTWWWKLCNDNGYKLMVNNSYSGSTIGYHGYDNNNYAHRSFITRMNNIGRPDIILIFGATNDSWAGEAVGEYKWADWHEADFWTFRPACAYMLDYLTLHHPNVPIYFIINSELRTDITESILKICAHYGVEPIQLKSIDKKSGHPSVKGMEAIAKQVAQAIKK